MHRKLADAVFMILGLGVVGEKGDSVLVSEAYFLHSLHCACFLASAGSWTCSPECAEGNVDLADHLWDDFSVDDAQCALLVFKLLRSDFDAALSRPIGQEPVVFSHSYSVIGPGFW